MQKLTEKDLIPKCKTKTTKILEKFQDRKLKNSFLGSKGEVLGIKLMTLHLPGKLCH